MKKLLMMLCMLCFVMSASAQSSEKEEGSRRKKETIEEKEALNGKVVQGKYRPYGMNFYYRGLDGCDLNVQYNLILKYIILDGGYAKGNGSNPSVTNWNVGAGLNYRYWFNKYIYLEGSVGAQYMASIVEWNDVEGKKTDGDFGLFAMPKLGLSYKGVGVVAGYRWDFAKFKFDKEHTNDHFMVGLNFAF